MGQPIRPEHLVKKTVNEMSMVQLGWAYAQLKGKKYMVIRNGEVGHWHHTGSEYNGHTFWEPFRPHLRWECMGDEIDRHDIQLRKNLIASSPEVHCAKPSAHPEYVAFGTTKLIAVVRSMVLMMLVDMGSMDVPSEEYIASTIQED
jgi:hypothetical protein